MRYQLAVSGHGSPFIPQNDDLPTLTEAIAAAMQWESYADTIGGMSEVTDIHTGAVVYCYGRHYPPAPAPAPPPPDKETAR